MLLPKHLPTLIPAAIPSETVAANATFSIRELDDVVYDYLHISFIEAQFPKLQERIISRALSGTTCWMPESSASSVLLITKQKTATKRSTSDILYLHRSFRSSGFWWGDTGSFEGCRLKYNPPLVEEPLALDPHSKIISDPRPLSNLRSMMESRTTPHHI